MHANPFPRTVKSEDGKTEIPNQRYQDWLDGYTTGILIGAKLVFHDIPKLLGIKISFLDGFFSKGK